VTTLVGPALGGSRAKATIFASATILATGGLAFALANGALGGALAQGICGLTRADPRWLWVAAAGFAGSLLATAAAWRSTVTSCGARLGHVDAWARYGVGSIVNTFLPARLGDAVRVGLFSRALPQQQSGRAFTAVGALGAVSVTEALTQAPVVGSAAALGAVPTWSIAVVGAVGAVVTGLVFATRKRLRGNRVRHVLDAVHSLINSPRQAAHLLFWSATATASRVLGAAAIAAAVGIPNPFEAGLIMTAVLSLATAVPVMPGNLGVTSGAIAVVLSTRGAPLTASIAAGVAFHAVEAAAGIAFGAGGALFLARYRTPAARRWSLRIATAAASLLLATGIGATALPGLG